jgi:hypothetical protein
MRAGIGWIAACALVAVSCVGPARSFAVYQAKAVDSADSAVSNARTGVLTARLVDEDRTFAPLTTVQLEQAALGAETAAGTFASIQPPDARSDAVRASLLPLLRRAAALLAQMRIAARRTDGGEVVRLATPLAAIADRLDAFSRAHR